MIRLWYSNYLERLVDALVANVEGFREAGLEDPFAPRTIVVPNRNIATFLKFEIARRTGIAANFELTFLNKFLQQHARAPGDDQVELLTREASRSLLLSAFDVDAPKPVLEYIDAAHDHDDRERRRFQLADRLARLYEEYELVRPRMISLWPERGVLDDEPFRSTEAWQRELWLDIFGDGGRLERLGRERNVRYLRTAQLLEVARFDDLGPSVHIFGLSYVARLYYSVFQRVAQETALFIYTLNPCMEYWEDVPAGWQVPEKKRFDKRASQQSELVLEGDPHDDDLFVDEEDPPPLRLWGRPGRDNIRLLNMLTESDFASAFFDPLDDGASLLHQIQHDILFRTPAARTPSVPEMADDGTVQFLKCPGIQREVEVVASEIWNLIEADEDLDFSDIAVIVNTREREAYQARIRSVFQNAYEIPHNVIDIDATAHRRYIEAADLLLRLPFGNFRRSELLRLITHPNVMATCPGIDAEEWVRWCDELNIVHGADHEDHEDTYIEEDLYNWDQGIKRLTLGSFMAAGEAIYDGAEGRYLPLELGPQETDAASRMATLARSLIADARFMRRSEMPLSEWIGLAIDLVNTYLEPVEPDDEFDRLRLSDRFAELADAQLGLTPVTWRVAYESLADVLESIEVSRGQYLAEGVVVSSFLPMRPIPFKVVFVTGMGEKQFPRADHKSPLDLRWAEPERWDNFSVRRQDEYMFLETLISTRQRLYLSYVSRDSRTGDELLPSAVVRELEFLLRRSYVGEEGLDELTTVHPLRRFNERYFEDLFDVDSGLPRNMLPGARREAMAKKMREDLDVATFGALEGVGDRHWQQVQPYIHPAALEAVRDQLGLCEVPGPEDAESSEEVRAVEVSVARIRKFLMTPLQGAAEFFLGLREDEEDDLFLVEDELFETTRYDQAWILRDVFLQHVDSMHGQIESLESIYDRVTERLVLEGRVPSGLFRESDRQKHLTVMGRWRQNLDVVKVGKNQPLKVVNFGRATQRSLATEFREPLRLDVPVRGIDGVERSVRVEITGKTDPFDENLRASLILKTSDPQMWKAYERRHFVRGMVDHVVLAAAGIADDRDFTVAINPNGRVQPDKHVQTWGPFSRDDARGYLTSLLSEMLSDVHPYLMPADAVFASIDDYHAGTSFAAIVERMKRSGPWASHSFKFGPIRDFETYTAPPNHDELIERRFGAFFDREREGRS